MPKKKNRHRKRPIRVTTKQKKKGFSVFDMESIAEAIDVTLKYDPLCANEEDIRNIYLDCKRHVTAVLNAGKAGASEYDISLGHLLTILDALACFRNITIQKMNEGVGLEDWGTACETKEAWDYYNNLMEFTGNLLNGEIKKHGPACGLEPIPPEEFAPIHIELHRRKEAPIAERPSAELKH